MGLTASVCGMGITVEYYNENNNYFNSTYLTYYIPQLPASGDRGDELRSCVEGMTGMTVL